MTRTILKAARLLDGTGTPPLPDPCLVIERGRIVEIFAGEAPRQVLEPAEVLELGDVTLLPGLIDCHVHLNLPGDGSAVEETMAESDGVLAVASAWHARRALEAGVTTLRDCGARGASVFEARRAFALGQEIGPRLVLCGSPLTTRRGHGWYFGGEVEGIAALRCRVEELVSQGADFVKVMGSGGGTRGTSPWLPTYSERELTAVVETAHALGRKVGVHCLTGEAIRRALAAGADHIEHASFTADGAGGQVFDREIAAAMAETGVTVAPTLSTRYHTVMAMQHKACLTAAEAADLERWQGMRDEQMRQVGMLHQRGVRLVAGTDAGWRHTPFNALHDELTLLHEAGLSAAVAIVAATSGAAEVSGLAGEIGILRAGYQADVIAVAGDPLQDIRALRRLTMVMRGGQLVTEPARDQGQGFSDGDQHDRTYCAAQGIPTH